MRLRNLSFLLVAVLTLSSCSVIKRVMTANSASSGISADSLSTLRHPDGILEDRWYECSTGGPTRRRMIVYLPSDYYVTSRSYPVLYMLHGARGNETSWITDGNALYIIDSLQRNCLMKKCIIVFPNMNQYDNDADFGNSSFKAPFDSIFDTDGTVESGFIKDVVEFVDNSYRTIATKNERAILGLSIGAMQTIFISAANPDYFDYVGLFSPFEIAPVKKGPHSDFYSSLGHKKRLQFENPPKLYFVAIGYWDFFYDHSLYMRHRLRLHHYPFEFYEGEGGHEWSSWKQFLCMFSKKIF